MKPIRRSIIRFFLLVFLVCMTHVLTSGTAHNQKTSKKETNALDRIPDPKVEEIRRIRTAKDWPNPIVMVNSDSFWLILHIDGQRGQEELNLANLENALTELKLDRWPLGRVVAIQENGLRSPGDNEKISEKSKDVKHVGIAQSDDRALALRLVAQTASNKRLERTRRERASLVS
jgi:hypothetical protein